MASGNTLVIFTAREGIPTATDGAVHAIYAGASTPAEGLPVLSFDSANTQYADFQNVMPRHFSGGSAGLTLTVYWGSATATTGSCIWNVSFRRVNDDAVDWNTTSFTYTTDDQTVTASPGSVAGEPVYDTIAFTSSQINGIAVGELFNMRVWRDAPADDMVGAAYLIAIEIKET